VLSPTNKIRGSRGRASFLDKRRDTLASDVHWVEIDLLRGGLPSVLRPRLMQSDYRILVSRADNRSRASYWPIELRQALPVIGIPLRSPDRDAPLDLGKVLRSAYDSAEYDATIDYRKKPQPPLSSADASWADRLLKEAGLR